MNTHDDSISIWQDGYECHENGLDIEDNPHQRGTIDYADWQDGWLEAYFQYRMKKEIGYTI